MRGHGYIEFLISFFSTSFYIAKNCWRTIVPLNESIYEWINHVSISQSINLSIYPSVNLIIGILNLSLLPSNWFDNPNNQNHRTPTHFFPSTVLLPSIPLFLFCFSTLLVLSLSFLVSSFILLCFVLFCFNLFWFVLIWFDLFCLV